MGSSDVLARSRPVAFRRSGLDRGDRRIEIWEFEDEHGRSLRSEVEVRIGKAFDVVAHKGASLGEIRAYAAHLRDLAARLYGPGAPTRQLNACPCCGSSAAHATTAATVYGVAYARCGSCGHAFIREQPTPEALAALFASSEEHASAYTDTTLAERRIVEIVRPKLAWALDVYERSYGSRPRSILDVGAGGGHFVAACSREGIPAVGYEISGPSRRFAREAFGIELRDADLTSVPASDERYDLVTFWGVLEYAPSPHELLAAGRRRLADRGMVVVEVPRFDSLGTDVQRAAPDIVARHLDPTSHVNCFSDAGLFVVLARQGLSPVAAWYFGMDVYELLVQIALRANDASVITRSAGLIPALQLRVDAQHWCDDIVVAASAPGG